MFETIERVELSEDDKKRNAEIDAKNAAKKAARKAAKGE